MISAVVDFCFTTLGQCWDFLSRVEIVPGVSLFAFCLGLVVMSVVIFGLIATVRVSSVGLVDRFKRNRRETRRTSDKKDNSKQQDNSGGNPNV